MTTTDPYWLGVSPPLAVDDDERDLDQPETPESRPPNVPPPDFTPAETPEQGSQD